MSFGNGWWYNYPKIVYTKFTWSQHFEIVVKLLWFIISPSPSTWSPLWLCTHYNREKGYNKLLTRDVFTNRLAHALSTAQSLRRTCDRLFRPEHGISTLTLNSTSPAKKEGAGCTFFHPASQWITCWSKNSKNNRKHLSIGEPLTSNNCVVLPAKSISHLETEIQGHPNPSKDALCKPAAFACILRQVCHSNVINAWAAMEMLNGDQ